MLTESDARAITGSEGEALLAEAVALASDRVSDLQAITRLRRRCSPDLAQSIWVVASLRRRGQTVWGDDAQRLFFDRDAYQMASAPECARYHAGLLAQSGARHALDLCAGAGMDSIAFARCGLKVTAYEKDPARAVFARANAAALGLADRIGVVCADVCAATFPAGADAAFFDPARRTETRARIVDPDQVTPPLSFLESLRRSGVDSILAKLSPAIDRGLGGCWDADTEFISDGGECKEALLRMGRLRTGVAASAVRLEGRDRVECPDWPAPVREEIGGWLYEPDPAVIRAGLVGHVARDVDGWLIDSQIAYVLSNRRVACRLAAGYRIETGFPYHRKRLQEELQAIGCGRAVIKRRGFPEEPDAVRKQLKLSGDAERVVLLTRSGSRLWALIGTRSDIPPAS